MDWLALIILAVGGAVVVPYLLYTKSQLLEARNYVGAMNRAQQAYHLENDTFADSIPELGLGIKNPTKYYEYSMDKTPLAIYNYGMPRRRYMRSYLGVVVLLPNDNPDSNDIMTQALLCETEPEVKPFPPIAKDGVLQCNPSMKDLLASGGIEVGKDWETANRAFELVAEEKYEEAMQVAQSLTSEFYRERVLEAIVDN